MLKKTLFATLMVALTPVLAWGAIIPAGDINNTPHASEDSLWLIVNNIYGTSFNSNADMQFAQVGTETFSFLNVSASAQAVFAANSQTFGWYDTATATENVLFTVTGSGYAVTGAGAFSSENDFGFFLTSTNGGSNTWYSEVALNSDGIDHQALYDLAALTGDASYAGSYLSAWEDLALGSANFDGDYNDLVLQIDTNIIPEPTTMTLLGIGLAGFAARRFRNKKS